MRNAFSLVELSIVLVILGLLVGGVLSGQALIHAAQLRTVAAQRDEFSTAIHTFKDKYFYLPGDLPNAGTFWGLLNPAPGGCGATYASPPKTCNGNGNGVIDSAFGIVEYEFFFQHLVNAGLIPYNINGGFAMDSSNYAKMKYSNNAVWYVNSVNIYFNGIIPANSTNYSFGGNYINSIYTPAVFTTEDAWNVDTKMDDGLPGTGNVISNKGGFTAGTNQCTTQADQMSDVGATYDFSKSGQLCTLYLLNIM